MKFTDTFIKRPVLAIVVSSLLVLLGGASLSSIKLRAFPALERSVITVTTIYNGASARTVQGFVLKPGLGVAFEQNIDQRQDRAGRAEGIF